MRGREEEGEERFIFSSDFLRASVLYHKTVFMRNRGAPTPRLRPVGLRTGTISWIHGDKVHNLLATVSVQNAKTPSQAHSSCAFSTHPVRVSCAHPVPSRQGAQAADEHCALWRRSLCTLPGSESSKFLWCKEASEEDPPIRKRII